MKDTKASYIDQLSSGYESKTVVEYDPATTEGQIGKEFEEKVETENWWNQDDREPTGVPKRNPKNGNVSFHEAAIQLRKIARKLSVMDMDFSIMFNDKKASKDDAVVSHYASINNDLGKIANTIKEIGSALQSLQKQAAQEHPAQMDPEPWLEESSPQTGDEEWIDIGTAQFTDPRDQIGKPLPQ